MNGPLPALLIVGGLTLIAFYFGHEVIRRIKLPSIVGFMLVGVVLGPSVLNIIDQSLEERLAFIPEIALGFVALSIGLELRVSWLRQQGGGIILTIFGQWFGALLAVSVSAYVVGSFFNCPSQLSTAGQFFSLALLLGALATATAPAGTVAVIQEYRAKGSLTQTLYVVVGYDDALAVIIYGFAIAAARSLLVQETGTGSSHVLHNIFIPLGEVALSLGIGAAVGILFCVLARNLKRLSDMLILIVGFVLVANGLSHLFHVSSILTNMVFGFVVGNTQPHSVVQRIRDDLGLVMPLFFILLFGLAGANLDVRILMCIGVLGVVYVIARSGGKIIGAYVSASIGGLEEKVKNYLGLGLLSQAGVAVGLALLASHELRGIGVPLVTLASGQVMTSGDVIASVLITTITASSVFFEIIGPICAKIALGKAGELPPPEESGEEGSE